MTTSADAPHTNDAAPLPLTMAAQALLDQINAPGFVGWLTLAGKRVRLGMAALRRIADAYGSYEALGAALMKHGNALRAAADAADGGSASASVPALAHAGSEMLRAAEELCRALLAECENVSDDDVDDVYDALGGDAVSVIMVCNSLLSWLSSRDGLGPYYAGTDPQVFVRGHPLRLKMSLRAVRDVHALLNSDDFGTLQPHHYPAVAKAALRRWHPLQVDDQAFIDDFVFAIGLGGLRRLLGGAEQPRREDAPEVLPNVSAAVVEPMTAAGTGAP